MAKKKLVADPFFPDNNFDVPDFNFDIAEPKDDRKPVVKVAKAVASGAIMGAADPTFIKRLAREALPPIYGEIADLTNQGTEGVKKLYNSATKEVKPALGELARSVNRLIPAENKRLKNAVKKIDLWANGDMLRRGFGDEKLQQEKNIALEIGQVFQESQSAQNDRDDHIESENRAERKIRDVIEQHRHRDTLSALNSISSSAQNLASYNSKITNAYQRKMLELQMRSYFLGVDNFKQNRIQTERQLAELKIITKNTALPEFVKLKQSEAWKEQLRNRFLSEMNVGLFGKRANFVRGFFDRISRSAKDSAINYAGLFAQGAQAADVAGTTSTMLSKDEKAQESGRWAGGLAGQFGAQRLGAKFREKMDASPRAAKFVKDAEYNVRNLPQKITKFANDDSNYWNEGWLKRLLKGGLRAGLGGLAPDMRIQQDHLMNMDPNSGNTLSTQSAFTNQNSKSLNEIIPGFLSRIFRELQVLRTGDTSIGLTSYDYTKNRFLDQGKVAKNLLKHIVNGSGKDANRERVERIMGDIGADKELDSDTRTALAEHLTKENFKGTELDPKFLTNQRSYAKNKKTSGSAKVIAGLFRRYFDMQNGELPNTLEASTKREGMNSELNKLGTDFNDARMVIQELVNMGQYEELRALGLYDENKRKINEERLIELYNSDKNFDPKSYGVNGKHVLKNGMNQRVQQNNQKFNAPAQNTPRLGMPKTANKPGNTFAESIEKLTTSIDKLTERQQPGSKDQEKNGLSFNIQDAADRLIQNTGNTVDMLGLIHKTLEAQLVEQNQRASETLESNGRFQSFVARFVAKDDPEGESKFDAFKDNMKDKYQTTKEGAKERLDTISGSLKNIYNKTFGRAVGAVKPVVKAANAGTKMWWNKAVVPGASAALAVGGVAGRFTRNLVSRIRDIYVEGDPPDTPRLQVAKLKRGKYFDAETGEPVYRLHQLKNGVKDEEGNIVLSKEEIPKAYFRNARGGIVFVAKEIMGSAWRGVGNFQEFMSKNVTQPLMKGTWGAAKFLGRTARNLFDMAQDVYVKGEGEPRLLAVTMKAGGYFSKDSQKPITRPSQIDGAVIDKEGNIVLSVQDLKTGIVDKYGRPITGPLLNAVRFGAGLVMGGLKLAGKLVGGIHSMMGKTFGGAGELLGNLMSGLSTALGGGKSHDVLVEIRSILDKRLPEMKSKKKMVDKDGDGVRDGSSQDIEKNRKAKINELDKLKGGVVDTGRENTFDRMARMAGEAKDTVKGWWDSATDTAGDVLDGDGKDNKDKKRTRRKGARTRLGRMKEAAAQKAAAAKDAAVKVGKPLVQSGVGQAVMSGAGKVAESGAGKAAAGIGSKALGYGGAALGAAGSVAGFAGKGLMRALPVAGLGYGLYSGANNLMDGNYGSAALDLGLAGVSGAAMVGGTAGVMGLGGALGTGALALGGAALTGIGAVLASPVILGGLAIAGAAYLGYKAYKYFTDPMKSPLMRLRLAQYGFGKDDSAYHDRVMNFEQEVLKYVTYDEGKATLNIADKDANKLIDIFGFKAQDTTQLTNWVAWVQKRFKPVFLTHMTALKNVTKDGKLSGVDSLDADIKAKYFEQVKMPEGPYNELSSPFPDLKTIAMGGAAVAFVTKEIEKTIKEDGEKAATKKKTTLTEAGAVTSNVAAAATADEMRDRLGLNKNDANALNAKAIDKANESVFKSFIGKAWKASQYIIPGLPGAVAAVTYVGEAIGKMMGMGVEAEEAVRFKTYGLIKMERMKVIALRTLEEYIDKGVTFEADGKAKWDGALDDVLSELKGDFGISDKHGVDGKNFIVWFNERFIKVYLGYRGWLHQSTGKKKQGDAEDSLKPEEKVRIALKVAGLSVWTITTSPWRDYTLGTDVGSIKENIQYLDDQVKASELNEKKKRGEKVTAPTSGLGTALSDNKPVISPANPIQQAADQAKVAGKGGNTAVAAPPDKEEEPKAIYEGDTTSLQRGSVGKLFKAEGELKDGKNADQFLKFKNDAAINGMNPEMLKLFKGMVQEYGELTGKSVTVNSGFRSMAEQAKLHAQDPNKAAAPGSSLHEFGLAVDIDSAIANDMDKRGLLRKYGFTRPVGGETWHIEPAGIQTNRDKAKKSLEEASALIQSGVGKGGGGWGTNPKAGKYSRNDGYAEQLLKSADTSTNVAESEKNGTGVGLVNENRQGEVAANLKAQMSAGGAGGGGGAMSPVGASGVSPAKGDAVANNKDNKPGQTDAYKNASPVGKDKGYMAVKDVISDAARTVGVDEKTMVRKAAMESSFNPNAKAGTSSATGLYQFTSGTWSEMMKKYGAKYGIPEGTQPTDARANAILAAQYMKDNRATLEKAAPGGKITAGDEYMAHFFGPGGASAMLRADPNQYGAMVLPKAAAANRDTFYNKNGQPRTVAEIRKYLDDKSNGVLAKHGIDESQFGGSETKAAQAAPKEEPSSNPNIVRASFKPAEGVSQPKDKSIPAQVPRANPEADRIRNQEKERMRASMRMSDTPGLNPAQGMPVPVQPQSRIDATNNMSATNNILNQSLEVQITSKEMLEKIAGWDLGELKKLIIQLAEGQSKGEEKPATVAPSVKEGKGNNSFMERAPRPITMSRAT